MKGNLARFAMLLLVSSCRDEPAIPRVEGPTRADRIVIIAPHVDDETLGAGGYAFDALRAGAFVAVVYLTAGDCNPLPAMIDDRRVIPHARDFLKEGHDRMAEGLAAMQSLGVSRQNVFLLGYPDRGLKAMLENPAQVIRSRGTGETTVPYSEAMSPGVSYALPNLLRDLERVLDEVRPNLVILPVDFDLHPDHASSAAIVRKVLRGEPRVLSYLVHAHRFPQPFRYSPDSTLDPPRRRGDMPWRTYALAPETEKKKLAVLRMYKTQRRDPHLYLLTEAFVRRNELFLAGRDSR